MNLIQFIKEGLKIAIDAIAANRLRSFLTMLGVAVGIFAIVSILTMVNSMQTSITKNISALGNTTIFVHHFPWDEGRQDWFKFFNRPMVNYKDFQKLKQNLNGVEGVMFSVTMRNQTIKAEGLSVSGVEVNGVTEDVAKVSEIDFMAGRFFSEVEHHLGSSVCMIGYNIAESLFGSPEKAVGNYIRIRGKRILVIGVGKKQGANMMFGAASEDDKIYIPYRVFAKLYSLTSRSSEKIIMIKASSHENLPFVENEIEGIMRASRGLRPQVENNFAINKQEALMNQFDKFFGYLEKGGWAISIFSILIGGFSIGNIMYISVKERTKEIGIQKALGATRSFILFQFISEAIMVCLMGGLIGLFLVFLLGLGVDAVLAQFSLPMSVSFAFSDLMVGVGLSAFIGLVSGVIPAGIAASLDPVEAIRQA
ncbi:MAG: ABC transporter permease [Bacteroidetes bacterium]|nr:ABC transporter permease [Bacteroidota bacterium]